MSHCVSPIDVWAFAHILSAMAKTPPIIVPVVDQLLAEIEAFLVENPMSETAFGVDAINDGHCIPDLREKRDVRASKIDRIRAFMRTHRSRERAA